MKVTPSQIKPLIVKTIKQNLVPYIQASPGVGKSDIVRSIAEEYNLKLIDIRLSQCEPQDLQGLIAYTEDKSKFKYVPLDLFPIEESPKGYKGTLIFFDEFSSASLSTQAAAYRVVLDKEVGQYKLAPNTFIICAGNLITDRAIVNRLSTAMQSRLIHLELEVSTQEWLKWAMLNNIDPRIIAYINFKPNALQVFKPDHTDTTFPCPRTYHFLSLLIKDEPINIKTLPLIVGSIGESEGRQFKTFVEIFDELPTIEEIISDPINSKLSSKPAVMYAIGSLISYHITNNNAEQLFKYVDRMPLEFQIILLRQAFIKTPSLISSPSLTNWIKVNQNDLN